MSSGVAESDDLLRTAVFEIAGSMALTGNYPASIVSHDSNLLGLKLEKIDIYTWTTDNSELQYLLQKISGLYSQSR